MTIEKILKEMANGTGLLLIPGGFVLSKDGQLPEPISNSKFYELFKNGFITFSSMQGHFEVDVIKLGLTPKGRDL